jgi:glycosyltransferase involved in cell wall biosynthesis
VNRTIVHTEQNKQTLTDQGADPDTIDVLPHGTYETFADYDHSDVTEEPNTALYFGHIVPDGGIGTVLDAVPEIVEELPDFTLLIAGNGRIPPDHEWILDEYSEHIELRNEFIPNEEVGRYFRRAGVVAIPHRQQTGHSGRLTVAYSFGKPVVATDVGDFQRLVGDAGCGRVVPPEDGSRLAEEIVALLRDDETRAEMAANADEMAARFAWDNVAAEHIEVYQRAISEHDPD